MSKPQDQLSPDVTVKLDWNPEQYDPTLPISDALNLVPAHAATTRLPSPYEFSGRSAPFLPPSTKTGSGARGLFDSLADAGDTVGAALRALIGHPEDVMSGQYHQIGGKSGPSIDVPDYASGAVDLAMAMPMIGGVFRGGEEASRPFFSALRQTIEDRAPNLASPEQMLAIAQKGSKAEELAYSGLPEFLSQQSGKVSKADVLAHLDANAPSLRESVVGGTQPPVKLDWNINNERRGWNGNEPGSVGKYITSTDGKYEIGPSTLPSQANKFAVTLTDRGHPNGYVGIFNTLDEAKAAAEAHATKYSGEMPKFTNYTLGAEHGNGPDPLATNHRELVVTLPSKASGAYMPFDEWFKNGYGEMQFDKLTPDQQDAIKHSYNQYASDPSRATFGDNNYNVPAGHAYGDPELDVNRLFHMRMNDRTTTAGEKGLMVDEIQSDWHQTGRESGYIDKDPNRTYSLSELNELYDEDGEPRSPRGGVPDAPFKKTWQELGFRRALQEAAQGGYDRVMWTTGAQQAERYSLAKHVDELRYDLETNRLTGTKNGGRLIDQVVKPEELSGFVGQDVAKKLTSQETASSNIAKVVKDPNAARDGIYPWTIDDGTNTNWSHFETKKEAEELLSSIPKKSTTNMVSGKDLEVGGQGMKGFYDKIIPDYANKVGKKYGVKAEDVEVPIGSGGNKYVYVKTNQKMADDELEHLLDSESDRRMDADGKAIERMNRKQLFDKIGMTEEQLTKQNDGEKMSNYELQEYLHQGMIEDGEYDHDKILASMVKSGELKQTGKTTEMVHSLKVTPEMRKDILKNGQPLFAAAPAAALPALMKRGRVQDLAPIPAHRPTGPRP